MTSILTPSAQALMTHLVSHLEFTDSKVIGETDTNKSY